MLVEHSDGQCITDADQVGEVHQRVDGREVALLDEPAQQRLGGASVLRGIDTESTKDTTPGGQRRQLTERRVADTFARRPLFGHECLR